MQQLRQEVANISGTMTTELQELGSFVQQYFQLITIKIRYARPTNP